MSRTGRFGRVGRSGHIQLRKKGLYHIYHTRWRFENHTEENISLRDRNKRDPEKILDQLTEVVEIPEGSHLMGGSVENKATAEHGGMLRSRINLPRAFKSVL